VEAAGVGSTKNTFVSLRVGDVQKHAPLSNSCTYRFPDPGDDRRAFGRVEIFKRIGVALVNFDDIDGGSQDVEVVCAEPECQKLQMKFHVEGGHKSTPIAREKKSRTKKRMDEAEKYIAEHNLEELIADAMREVILKKPVNPEEALSNYISQKALPVPPCRMEAHAAEHARKSLPPLVSEVGETQKPPIPQSANQVLPSVATWCLSLRPALAVSRAESLPEFKPGHQPGYDFKQLASVGTWILPSSPNPSLSAGESDGLVHLPGVVHLPSVGAWLQRRVPVIERPWFYRDVSGPQSDLVHRFVKLVHQRDVEIQHLKGDIVAMQRNNL